MKPSLMNRGDQVLAALVILLALIVLVNLAFLGSANSRVCRSAAPYIISALPASSASSLSPPSSPVQPVQLSYLYADWCSYCTLSTPAVNSVVMRLGRAVNYTSYDEALRKTDPKVMALYVDYKARRLFNIFPTLVAKGPKGEASIGGLMDNETAILDWVCSQYTQPPAACG